MSFGSEVAGLDEEDRSGEEGANKRQAELLVRTLRALKLGLGKLWRRQSVTITEYDPSFKVAYLGNVLTGWAKGEGCAEKPVGTLWRNYCASSRADVSMTVTVSAAGLRAVTREHGLTEYWSHRVTFCAAPPAFPRVFCWVYRHEGRRLKQELRCHAVLCSKASVARTMATQLQARLGEALREFRRDKLGRQQARLSLANAVYAQPSLPRRRILLSTGASNYRPPLERSKSAPKLGPIDEISEEESIMLDDEDEDESCHQEGGSLSSESGVVIAACPSTPNPPSAPTSEEGDDEVCNTPSALPIAEDSDESGYDELPVSVNKKVKHKNKVSFSCEDIIVPDTCLDEATSYLLSSESRQINDDNDSISDNDEITSEYIPTCKYSTRPVLQANDDDLLASVLRCISSPEILESSSKKDKKLQVLTGATVDSSYVEV